MGDEDMIKLNKKTASWDHRFVQKTVGLENDLSLVCPTQKLSNCQKKLE